MDAGNIGFPDGSFDFVLSGFIGWDYCFDFLRGEFTSPDKRMQEIWRVLRDGGRICISSWELQGDLDWMEAAVIRHYPAILSDPEFIRRRPLGYSRENTAGYEKILRTAGFTKIAFGQERLDCVSSNETEWWEQIRNLGWGRFFNRSGDQATRQPGDQVTRQPVPDQLEVLRPAILADLQQLKHADGYHFTKTIIFASGVKYIGE